MNKEPLFINIEALVGFASVSRGTIQLIKNLQTRISSSDLKHSKMMDLCRLLYACSLLSTNKLDVDLKLKVEDQVLKKLS